MRSTLLSSNERRPGGAPLPVHQVTVLDLVTVSGPGPVAAGTQGPFALTTGARALNTRAVEGARGGRPGVPHRARRIGRANPGAGIRIGSAGGEQSNQRWTFPESSIGATPPGTGYVIHLAAVHRRTDGIRVAHRRGAAPQPPDRARLRRTARARGAAQPSLRIGRFRACRDADELAARFIA